jgi:hypothetical protein
MENILLGNSDVQYWTNIFDKKQSDNYFKLIEQMSFWNKIDVTVYNMKCDQDMSCSFTRDNMPNFILNIKKHIEKTLYNKYDFDICLCEIYKVRSKTKLNGECTAIILFGPDRLVHLKDKNTIKSIKLQNGSLLLISHFTQTFYEFDMPNQNIEESPIISLKFMLKEDILKNMNQNLHTFPKLSQIRIKNNLLHK